MAAGANSSANISESEILERFSDIVARSLHVDRCRVTPNAHLCSDLGAESLDLLEITMEVESAFNISVPDKSILDTAEEVLGADVLQRDGILTDVGLQLLRKRLPDEDRHLFQGDAVAVKDVQTYFLTVRSWTRMIHHLAQHTPSACGECGGELKPSVGLGLLCAICGAEVNVPSGEELNREWVRAFYDNEYAPAAGLPPRNKDQKVQAAGD